MMIVWISPKPNDADAYYYGGIDWEKLGNTDGAIADYRNAVASIPRNDLLKTAQRGHTQRARDPSGQDKTDQS